jgi:hypothetical protein
LPIHIYAADREKTKDFVGRKTGSLETKPNRSDINKVKHSSKPTVTQNPKL